MYYYIRNTNESKQTNIGLRLIQLNHIGLNLESSNVRSVLQTTKLCF